MSAQQSTGRGKWDCSAMLTRVGVLVSAVFFVAVGIASADSPSTPRLSTDELVGEALDREIHARDEQRNALLASALKQDPEHQQARWHSGYVRYRNEWVPFDTLATSIRTDPAYEKYLEIRKQFPDTVSDHRDLAKWCEKLDFPELSRAHEYVANELDSESSPTIHAMSEPMFGTLWDIDGDWTETVNGNPAPVLDFKQVRKWKTKLNPILRGLFHSSKRTRDESLARFQRLDPRELIVAIEFFVDDLESKPAEMLVMALGTLSGQEIDQALLRLTIESESDVVRNTAVEQLQSRPEKVSIPLLLAELKTPFAEPSFQYGPSSEMPRRNSYQWTVHRECYDVFEEIIFEIHGPSRSVVSLRRNPNTARVIGVEAPHFPMFEKAVTDTMSQYDLRNQQTQQRNERIYWALKRLTHERLSNTPESWWSWWNEKTDSMSTEKPLVQTYRSRTVQLSCFAAGTPVVTFDGLRSIETIEAGDLVLSQDVESGRLAYRPVVRTTLRMPTRLLTVSADEETFDCTGNHAFWVPGDGWVAAKRLKSGAAIHRVRGTSLIGSVEYGPTEQVYNLVVPDFHTYFVGKQGILVHDVTPTPVSKTDVPGRRKL